MAEAAFAGRVAVVTGGSRGIGREVGRRLAQEGADLLLVARTAADLDRTAAEVAADTGRRVEVVATDLRTLDGCRAVADAVTDRYGRVDILVNCAGATRSGPFLDLDDATWQDGFDLKFFGAVRLCRLLWPLLRESRGSVVNIVGGMARTPAPDFTIGGSVNAALANFSKALAGLGLQDDVNVNVVHPGLTATERQKEIVRDRADRTGSTVEEVERAMIERQGVRRLGMPEDIANAVAFLCRPESRHVQGVALAVDGGGTTGVY